MGRKSSRNCLAIPSDFPRKGSIEDAYDDWQVCEEVIAYIVRECIAEKKRNPLIPEEEILEMHLERARTLGWGSSAEEINWIFQRVVKVMGCGLPDCLQ